VIMVIMAITVIMVMVALLQVKGMLNPKRFQ
jgi:hypothetical protein